MTDKNTSALTAYAVVLRLEDDTLAIAAPGKTPDCARQAVSPFEGAHVFGLATIAVEPEAVSGMQWRLEPPTSDALDPDPVAWLIEATEQNVAVTLHYRHLHLHNAISDYRSIHKDATSTPLYAHPPTPAAVDGAPSYNAKDMQAAWQSGYNTYAMGGRTGGVDAPAAVEAVPDCAHNWNDYGQVNQSWCCKCHARAVTGYEDQPFTAPPTQGAGVDDAVAKLVTEWLFDDGYLTGNPKIDEPTIHRAQAKRECSQQLRAALAGQPKGEVDD